MADGRLIRLAVPHYLAVRSLSIFVEHTAAGNCCPELLAMSTEPLDVSPPLVKGLSHISLVAPTVDLFYGTIQFYESLGFQAVALVCHPLCMS